jgi:hypothetical protein
MEFTPEQRIDDALVFRVVDPADAVLEDAYLLLETCALQQGYALKKPFYHVLLNVYGDSMVDVVAPILPADGERDV